MTSEWMRPWVGRVVRVHGYADGRRRASSGYLISGDLVLTAGHAIQAGMRCAVRLPGGDEVEATVAWRGGDTDAAMLRLADPVPLAGSGVTWALIAGRDPVGGRIHGYPRIAEGAVEVLAVHVWPEGTTRDSWLRVDVSGPVPRDEGEAIWPGLSGAAVLDNNDRLIGVVSAETSAWGAGRLMAVPVTSLLKDPGFRALLDDPATVPIGDGCELIRTGRAPLRWGADDVSESEPLKAKYAIVPFVRRGRADVLDELDTWCRDERPLAVRVLTGDAGTGKSRLAIELCRTLDQDGWHAGFAVDPVGPDWADWSPRRPTLVVFDYAEDLQWTDPVRLLFNRCRELAAEDRLAAPVRILLISRREGQWLGDIDRGANAALSTMVGRPHNSTLTLSRLSFTPDVSQAHLVAALDRFVELGPNRDVVVPDVSGSGYDRPLLVHIAALLAARGEPVPHSGDVHTRLLDQLLSRERERWERRLDVAHPKHAQQAVCVATLTAPTVDEAVDLLRAVPSWENRPRDVRDAVAERLRELYPDGAYGIAPLEPDMIAGHLIATTAGLPEILLRLQSSRAIKAHHHGRILQIISLIADDYPEVGRLYRERLGEGLQALLDAVDTVPDALTGLLRTRLATLVPTAVSQLVDKRDTKPVKQLAAALELCRGDAQIGAAAVGLAGTLPYPNPVFARLATALSRHEVDHLRSHGGDGLAEALILLARNLFAVGLDREALTIATEYAGRIPAMLTDTPKRAVRMVNELIRLGVKLDLMGRGDEAATVLGEATLATRRLSRAGHGTVEMSRAMEAYGSTLSHLGRHREALAVMGNRVRLQRTMVVEDGETHLPGLVRALNNHAVECLRNGRPEAGRESLREAIELLRGPAPEPPELWSALAPGPPEL